MWEFNQMSEIKKSNDPVQMSGKDPLGSWSCVGVFSQNMDFCYG